AVLMLGTVTGLGAAQVLRVGSDVAYPPFEFFDDATGEFVGFDLDVIREEGRRLGIEVGIEDVARGGIIPGLLAGHYDASITAPADLGGKRVAVQIGTTGQCAAESIEGAIVEHYPLTPEAFLALKLGRADAAVVDELVAIEEARANPGEVKVVGTPFTIEYYGIAMRKDREDLLRNINRALAQMKADGTYDEIYERWFGTN